MSNVNELEHTPTCVTDLLDEGVIEANSYNLQYTFKVHIYRLDIYDIVHTAV